MIYVQGALQIWTDVWEVVKGPITLLIGGIATYLLTRITKGQQAAQQAAAEASAKADAAAEAVQDATARVVNINDLSARVTALNGTLTEEVVFRPLVFEQVLDALPDGLIVINEDGIIQMVNKQMERLFGYPRRELIGQSVGVLIPPHLREAHSQHIHHFFSIPTVRPMNMARALEGVRRDGSAISVQIQLGPVVSSHGILALGLVRKVEPLRQSKTKHPPEPEPGGEEWKL